MGRCEIESLPEGSVLQTDCTEPLALPTHEKWCLRTGSNRRHLGLQPNALPAELRRHWSGRRDSNPRRTAWKADTLPLSYTRSIYYSCFPGVLVGSSLSYGLVFKVTLWSRRIRVYNTPAATIRMKIARISSICAPYSLTRDHQSYDQAYYH